jgi:dihydrolipoamide dehydrogenase
MLRNDAGTHPVDCVEGSFLIDNIVCLELNIMSEQHFDVIVIGSGPGGYVAAERAGARGKSVLLIEKEHLGGVCMNYGCIPTKTLLHSAKIYYQSRHSEQAGVLGSDTRYDLNRAMAWKAHVVLNLRKGIEFLMKRHRVTVVYGRAKLIDQHTVRVDDEKYHGQHLILATGSSPAIPSILGINHPSVLTSKEMLEINTLPENVVIIGGGTIGIEFASYFRMLNVPVTVIEMMDEILPNFDPDIGSLMRSVMSGVDFHVASKVVSVDDTGVHFRKDGKDHVVPADRVLIAVGRVPNTEGIGLDALPIQYDKNGIRVDDSMQTTLPHIYAIGDVTGKSLLAHSASRMGEVAVNQICGKDDRMRYDTVPWVVYAYPEVAGVGIGETEAKTQGRSIRKATLPMRMNGRFFAEYGNERGFCKVLLDDRTNVICGVFVVGGVCSEMIFGAAAMIDKKFRIDEIKKIIFPHPTVSEMIRETVWSI